jgi:hypothetical protein
MEHKRRTGLLTSESFELTDWHIIYMWSVMLHVKFAYIFGSFSILGPLGYAEENTWSVEDKKYVC